MKFSILVPSYKSKYFKECIDSILDQTYRDFEIVIVNDASPEDLDSIVALYNDERILYYKNENNCGVLNVVDNWNKCLEFASGNYVICMGDDDRLLSKCLEEYVQLMEKYPGLGVYHAWTEMIDENSQFCGIQHPRPEYESALSLIWNRWNGRYTQYIGDFCFDRECLKKNNGFYSIPMAWASDDITAAMAADNKGIANTQTICFQYRVNSQTITNSGNWKSKIEATLLEEVWYQNYFCRKSRECLSDLDSKYLKLLEEQLVKRFSAKYKWELEKGFSSHSFGLLYGIWRRKDFCLNISDIIKTWLKAKLINKE